MNTLALQISLSAGIHKRYFNKKLRVSIANTKNIKKTTYKYLFSDENIPQSYFNSTYGLNFDKVL